MSIAKSFSLAQERYATLGVDVEHALAQLKHIPISLHCWQGDDVGGFENFGGTLGGGLAVTGNYPGKARTPDELRADLDKALSLNRVAAWIIGTRNMIRALLIALWKPRLSARRKRAAISPRASRCRRKPGRCRSVRSGIIIARARAFPSPKRGWAR